MNRYTTEFFSQCPANNVRIKYTFVIETNILIQVEQIIDAVMLLDRGFHEELADQLYRKFGGKQTLTAYHHGVLIETERPVKC